MNLEQLRAEIDAVDDRLTEAYLERLKLVEQVAEYKRTHDVGIEHSGREEAIFRRLTEKFGEEYETDIRYLYADIINYSKVYQRRRIDCTSETACAVSQGVSVPKDGFAYARVACQGVAGAYSELAAEQLVRESETVFFPTWDAVFRAVADGEVPFGVLPIENSTAGSVNEVYDLLMRYRLTICGGRKVHIRHCLVGLPEASLESVRTVLSHPQALSQCSAFLAEHGLDERTATNTAIAAETVVRDGNAEVCAIASRQTAELYGLKILASGIQNAERNDTRFLLVSAERYVDPQANRVSLVVLLPHRKGSLFQLLGIVAAYGVNVVKLESRPIPGKNFEFLFYLDLEGNIREVHMQQLVESLNAYCKETVFLGSYQETEEADK